MELLILLFALSLVGLGAAAAYLVSSLSFFSKKVGISEFVVGGFVLAMATTLPELASTLVSNLEGVPELGIGTALGSIITNLCLILALVFFINPVKVKEKVESHIFLFALTPAVLFFILARDGFLSRLDGALFLLLFLVYQFILFKEGLTLSEEEIEFEEIAHHYVITPIAVFVIIVSAFLVVDIGAVIAQRIGISAAVMGLILVAFGTSLPELITGVVSAFKKENALALGDVIGANILDILFVIGLAIVIKPISLNFSNFSFPLIIGFASTALLLIYTMIRKKADRLLGAMLIAIYLFYLVSVIT